MWSNRNSLILPAEMENSGKCLVIVLMLNTLNIGPIPTYFPQQVKTPVHRNLSKNFIVDSDILTPNGNQLPCPFSGEWLGRSQNEIIPQNTT